MNIRPLRIESIKSANIQGIPELQSRDQLSFSLMRNSSARIKEKSHSFHYEIVGGIIGRVFEIIGIKNNMETTLLNIRNSSDFCSDVCGINLAKERLSQFLDDFSASKNKERGTHFIDHFFFF